MKVQETELNCVLRRWLRQKLQEEEREVEVQVLGWLAKETS